MGAEPGEGFVDALLEGDFGTSEHSIGFVHRGDVGAAGGPQCRLRPVSVPVGRRGDPSRQTSAQWLAVAYQWFSWNGEPRRFHVVMRSSARPVALRMGRATLRPGWVRSVEPEALKLTDLQT